MLPHVEQERIEDRPEHQPLADLRFSRLVGREAWRELPLAVRMRFAKRLTGDRVAVYRGRVVFTRFNRLGRLLAGLLRPIGAPLPLSAAEDVAAVVTVCEDEAGGGQWWSRMYGRPGAPPQVIHSAKRFAGPTGLEEHLGFGIGMALRVEALGDGLRFASDHYFWALLGWRLRLPRWMQPGRTVVEHHDRGGGWFAFDLELRHPLFGLLVRQHALFRDA
jgi:hypothetical protein